MDENLLQSSMSGAEEKSRPWIYSWRWKLIVGLICLAMVVPGWWTYCRFEREMILAEWRDVGFDVIELAKTPNWQHGLPPKFAPFLSKFSSSEFIIDARPAENWFWKTAKPPRVFTNKDLKSLQKIPNVVSLKIDIPRHWMKKRKNPAITDRGLLALKTHKSLDILGIQGGGITDEGIAVLRTSFTTL